MKKLNYSFKVAVFSLLLFLSSNLYASKFVLSDDGLIDPRTITKVEEIGNEAQTKLGVNIYVYAKQSLNLKKDISTEEKIEYIKNFESQITPALIKPYVLLTVSIEDTHVNLIESSTLKDIVDKNEILNGYVVPLLASKDKNSTFSKASAAILNGYAAIADIIAESKGIELQVVLEAQVKLQEQSGKYLCIQLLLLEFYFTLL